METSESEIDDPRFFLAKDGNTNPQAELSATLEALYNEKRFDDNATGCRFPARKAWLQEKLDLNDLPELECTNYQKMIDKLLPESATIVFPSAHINSPASMFGHTFLRVNSEYNSKLLAYAINYAADADQKKENGFIFAIKGVFGGYLGNYSLLPYYDKLKEYRDTEKRDIWEYDLNLSKKEVLQMVRHIWELNGIQSYYYFFTENCSYNMLWLLEIARPTLHLRDHFLYQVAPIETVFAAQEEGLLRDTYYRPSKRTKLLKYKALIDDTLIDYVKELPKDEKLSLELFNNRDISIEQKQYIYEAAIEYLEYDYAKNSMKKEKYLKQFHQLSSKRAALGKGEKLTFENPQDPLHGHNSVKLELGSLYRDKNSYAILGYRPAQHTLEDPAYGYLRGTQIEFFDLELALNHNKLFLENLTLLSIASIAQRDKLFSPISWRTKFGWDTDYLYTNASFLASAGAGFSWGNQYGYIYMMLDPLVYIKKKTVSGIGGSIGLNIDKYKLLHLNLELTQRYYSTQDTQLLLKTALSTQFSRDLQLKGIYQFKEKKHITGKYNDNSYKLLLNYYF